jgi:hypothetical protein
MAESQEIFAYSTALHGQLVTSFSRPRLSRYLTDSDGDQDMAIKLYLWNARIAKAFLFPLHVAEVTLRNAVHASMSARYGGPNWMMPNAAGPIYPYLHTRTQDAIVKAISRLTRVGFPAPTADDVIGSLSFDFWSNLFRHPSLWAPPPQPGAVWLLRDVFPNLPARHGKPDVQQLVARINKFRNRVAHHEPIYGEKHREILDAVLTLIGYRSPATADWAKQHSTVMEVIRTPPTPATYLPGKLLSTVKMAPPPILGRDTTLAAAIPLVKGARPPIALVPDTAANPPFKVVTATMLLDYIGAAAAELENMIDLGATTIAAVLDHPGAPTLRVDQISIEASTGDAQARFFPAGALAAERPQFLLVMDRTASIAGVISRPEVRY